MKKLKLNRIFLFAVLLAALASAHAAPSFSGAVGGSFGFDINVPLDDRKMDFNLPLAGFTAVQVNLAEWCVVRGELAIDATNFDFDDIFSSAQAAIKLNELSLVFIRRAVTSSSFFSAFLGSYEQVGSDAFLMRQFGVEPISSRLSESHTNLTGIPILSMRGAGLSYIVNFDKAPIATGAYLYFGKDDDKNWTLNLDARFSFVTNLFTMDFLAGISSPLQDKHNGEDVVLLIDTIRLHGGINFLMGSKFGHNLLIQAGLRDVVVKGKEVVSKIGDELNFLIEPRINFNKFCISLTGYAYDRESLKELVYLPNDFGAAFSVYKEDVETKNGLLAFGVHFIGSLAGKSAMEFISSPDIDDITINAYVSPFIEVPVSPTARFEAMAQAGVCDILGDRSLDFRLSVAARKKF